MTDSVADGRTRVYLVASISSIAAPTTTELNAGVDVSGQLTPDGLAGFQPDTADVDNSKLNSTFTTNTVGRASYSGTGLRFIKQTGTDTVYNLLVYGYQTNIVIRRDVTSSTAWASTQPIEVYPVTCGHPQNADPAPNTMHTFFIPMKISTEPNLRAAVA